MNFKNLVFRWKLACDTRLSATLAYQLLTALLHFSISQTVVQYHLAEITNARTHNARHIVSILRFTLRAQDDWPWQVSTQFVMRPSADRRHGHRYICPSSSMNGQCTTRPFYISSSILPFITLELFASQSIHL
ncbi:Uncharacterized protein HZ326_29468 [Fusarium oxysporum f. sp. albedinis]|nr:Uncharacterized protein HZ326_29468 [Fusarium oxysporum f. sp. albedinis]